ncbi:hypothetical protein DVH24_036714 [Malus domestica]|uniref:Uncharacterized protein n=1 Tax=Malus domestica TaxID=3750 RepID=A0A498IMB9_MALDO|nr:hypothetical protein DVH24_036714 [Malus domestica]
MKRSTPRQILGLSGLYLTMKPVALEVSLAKYLYVTSPKIVEVLAAPLERNWQQIFLELMLCKLLKHWTILKLVSLILRFQNCHVRKTSNAAAHRLAKLNFDTLSCICDIGLSTSFRAKHDQMDEFLSNSSWRTFMSHLA